MEKKHTTASGEDYLEAILMLQQKHGTVRSVDVSHQLEVSKASVSYAVTTLREGGFLTMGDDFSLHLTEVGREVAERVYEKHRFFFEMLTAAGGGTPHRPAGSLPHGTHTQRGELSEAEAVRGEEGRPC